MGNTRYVFVFLFLILLLGACGNDDDNGVQSIPPRLLAEQAPKDDEVIRKYLETHFYNYEEFAANGNSTSLSLKIDTLAGANADKIPLIDQVSSVKVKVSNNHLGLETEETDIEHTLYYLVAREGIGQTVTVADSAYIRYKGMALDSVDALDNIRTRLFDETSTPIWQSLPGTVRGYFVGASKLKPGGMPVTNPDGTFSVEGYGIGLVVMPSGMGYFNAGGSNRPSYSPLVFILDVYASVEDTDHDNDGIPSIQEDLDGNEYLFDDNTDFDDESANRTGFFANFLDSNDDNDNKLTKDEIKVNADGSIEFYDTDNDGTPDHLDADSSPPEEDN